MSSVPLPSGRPMSLTTQSTGSFRKTSSASATLEAVEFVARFASDGFAALVQ